MFGIPTGLPYGKLAIAAVFVGLLVAVALERADIKEQKAKVIVLTSQREEALRVNKAEVNQVKILADELKTMTESFVKATTAAVAAAQTSKVEQALRLQSEAQVRVAIAKAKGAPSCAQFLSQDIDVMCPGVLDSLRSPRNAGKNDASSR